MTSDWLENMDIAFLIPREQLLGQVDDRVEAEPFRRCESVCLLDSNFGVQIGFDLTPIQTSWLPDRAYIRSSPFASKVPKPKWSSLSWYTSILHFVRNYRYVSYSLTAVKDVVTAPGVDQV